ncbi:MAG: hypothetical protein ABF483_06200 [Liquorilactobacillus nagelii]|jgi:uncharacterized membrane protein|uniref:Uncharacterized protein n=1 Tax=Liquorilactobacillus nagelii TaxID=82688 RepID=A0A3Q8CLE9_9LACO|nr:hypothetical protein [Liquorilactobacillus nagelii]AUJ31284.1 hypothetical protein BSQ50_01080 [Liquorilactobacillus nagelii]MCC7616152.1 hypothetical protein [Liquorilactobacillus nagelii]MCI1699229.1 hypothetical protein [Liquorilactobacillus nagelii]MCP9315038.1 hypothetical protein [Liquorilactobacillus nagelii]ULQ48719.1 hypothetical protein J6864_06925 [Liquorilactobacillus nagelii]
MELSRRKKPVYLQKEQRGHGLTRLMTFLLLLAFCVSGFSYALRVTIFDESTVQQFVTQKEFVQEVNQKLNTVLAATAQEYNIPSRLTTGLLTEKQVKADLTTAISNIYAGKTQPVDTVLIQQQVKKNLQEKATALSIPTDNSIYQTAVSTLLSGLQSELQTELNTQKLAQPIKDFTAARRVNQQVGIIALSLTVVLLVLLLLSERNFWNWLHYLGLAALPAGIIILLGSYLLTALPLTERLSQLEFDLSGLAGSVIDLTAKQLNLVGVCLFAVGVVGLLLGWIGRRQQRS